MNATGVYKQCLEITNGITTYIKENDGFIFEIQGIQNPNSTQISSSFEYHTYDSSYNSID